mgnify:CR=1 FL=1
MSEALLLEKPTGHQAKPQRFVPEPMALRLLVPDFEDIRLSKQITEALRESGYVGLRTVEVELEGQTVLLRGTVYSYYLKQMAQEITRKVPGVRHIRNKVTVTR